MKPIETTIAIRLDPAHLDNPDADIRYQLPMLLGVRSGGILIEDGYDYIGEEPILVVFMKTTDLDSALVFLLDVVRNVPVLGNDLSRATAIAFECGGKCQEIYPPDLTGQFLTG